MKGVIRDVIPQLELFQPNSADDALALLAEHGSDAWVYAGGLDTLDWFKDRVKRPRVVVDIGAVESMREIRTTGDGIEIGAMARLIDVVNHPEIQSRFPALAYSAKTAASPQIRNQGTIGGNIGQDTRCWYYRDGWSCYRAGGNICYADTPTAMNREHAILGASRCVAVNPSDTAPVLVALDAEMVVRNTTGERVIPAQDFFIGPAVDIMRMTALQPGDILTSIRIPWTWANTRFYFEKTRDRAVWDFPLANVASAAKINNGVIEDIRIVANGVAPYPVRFLAAEDAVRGRQVGPAVAMEAGDIAVNGVRPLRHNAYKVTLLRNLVKRSVQGAEA
jgi:xanthine dehydrogenase YagS FAD-binding subunit